MTTKGVCGQSFDPTTLYPRSSELEDGRVVEIYQSEIGDVGCVVWDAAIVLAKFYEHLAVTSNLDNGDTDFDEELIDGKFSHRHLVSFTQCRLL